MWRKTEVHNVPIKTVTVFRKNNPLIDILVQNLEGSQKAQTSAEA